MSAEIFVDTNVLVYGRDSTERDKQRRARAWLEHLWRSGTGRLSVQVLQEFYVTVTERLDPGMKREAARNDVRALTTWNPVLLGSEVLEIAFQVQDRYAISWWDAQIVAAAWRARCAFLLTEDLQSGQRLGDLVVVSPFEVAPDDL